MNGRSQTDLRRRATAQGQLPPSHHPTSLGSTHTSTPSITFTARRLRCRPKAHAEALIYFLRASKALVAFSASMKPLPVFF